MICGCTFDGRIWAPLFKKLKTAEKQDKVVFIFNFFDELRRIAPVKR